MGRFTEWWSVEDNILALKRVDAICLVSFGATKTKLTRGTQKAVELGQRCSERFPQAKVTSGEFTGNPKYGVGRRLKKKAFPNLLFAGKVISTIEEAIKWRTVILKNITPEVVVIITDEMHSRSAKRVSNRVWNGIWFLRLWKRLTGKSLVKIYTLVFPSEYIADIENPMTTLRSLKKWIIGNVLRELFLMFVPFGYTIMKKLNVHQPIYRGNSLS